MAIFLFPSILSRATNEKKTEITAKTLGEAVEKLVEKYGQPFSKLLFEESGEINRYFRFYVKGKSVSEFNDMNAPLNDEDEIAILIIIGGG